MARALIIILLCFSSGCLFAQNKVDSTSTDLVNPLKATDAPITGMGTPMKIIDKNEPKTPAIDGTYSEPMWSSIPKPTVGLGIGLFSYFGNLHAKNYFENPGISRFASSLTLSERINDYFLLNLYGITGKLGVAVDANTKRNANFESLINLGGISTTYNFGHYLSPTNIAHPFVSLGLEAFTFNSKTDLYDKNGNRYYYWKDGSIRNISQASPDSTRAKVLVRDYTYETDLRQANLYNQETNGKYPTNSYAIPIGLGTIIDLSDRVKLNLHCVFHFTFTNYIDGLGNSAGSGKDNFMETGFSLHWDLLGPKKLLSDTLSSDYYNNVDIDALFYDDTDGDGVKDTADICPGTKIGAIVDEHGCPTDGDGDGVADYLDKELNSKPFAVVDDNGVTVSDSIIKQRFIQFYDTTAKYAEVITKVHGEYDRSGGKFIQRDHHITPGGTFIPHEYTVLLGTYHKGLPTSVMSKYLSIHDIETTTLPDSSIAFTVGHYKGFKDANSRKQLAIKDGQPDAKVVYKKDGQFIETDKEIVAPLFAKEGKKNKNGEKGRDGKNKYSSSGINIEDSILVANTKGTVFRVQLGAYGKRLSKSIFKNVDNLIEVKTEDNLYKYMTGSYTKFSDAAKARVEMAMKGYEGAFINAWKDGKRIPLTAAGATPTPENKHDKDVDSVSTTETKVNVINKNQLVFKVQIGVYKNEPPAEERAKFKKLKEHVEEETTSIGLIRYTCGKTSDYNEILKVKTRIKEQGLEDAFIICFFNGQFISIQEALELLK